MWRRGGGRKEGDRGTVQRAGYRTCRRPDGFCPRSIASEAKAERAERDTWLPSCEVTNATMSCWMGCVA